MAKRTNKKDDRRFFDIELGERDANYGTGAEPEWSFAYIIWDENYNKWWSASSFESEDEAYEAAAQELNDAFGKNGWAC